MSVRVSRSNRAAQPASTGIRAPGLQKLGPTKGVPVPVSVPANYIGMQVNDIFLGPDLGFLRVCTDGGQFVGWQDIETDSAHPSDSSFFNAAAVARLDGYASWCRSKGIKMHYAFAGTPAFHAVGGATRARSASSAPLQYFLGWLLTRYYKPGGAYPGVLEAIDPWNEPNNPGAFVGTYQDDPSSDLTIHSFWLWDYVNYWCENEGIKRLTASDKLLITSPSFTDVTGGEPMRNYITLCNGNAFFDIFSFHPYDGAVHLAYNKNTARFYLSIRNDHCPEKPIWCSEVGWSVPTRGKIVDAVNDMHSLGFERVNLYAWDIPGLGDMRIANALGLSGWNALFAKYTA